MAVSQSEKLNGVTSEESLNLNVNVISLELGTNFKINAYTRAAFTSLKADICETAKIENRV